MDRGNTTPSAEPTRGQVETERLRALVASLGLGVLVEDEARRVSLANQEFCTLFQMPVSPAELVGSDCAATARQAAALIREPDAFLARIEQVLAGRIPITGDEINFHDGRVLERDYTPIAVDSVGRGHVWIYRDVTRLRQDAE